MFFFFFNQLKTLVSQPALFFLKLILTEDGM